MQGQWEMGGEGRKAAEGIRLVMLPSHASFEFHAKTRSGPLIGSFCHHFTRSHVLGKSPPIEQADLLWHSQSSFLGTVGFCRGEISVVRLPPLGVRLEAGSLPIHCHTFEVIAA